MRGSDVLATLIALNRGSDVPDAPAASRGGGLVRDVWVFAWSERRRWFVVEEEGAPN